MMGWMEALGITRLGGGGDRESLVNWEFHGAHTLSDRDMYSDRAPSHRGRLCRIGEGCVRPPKNGGGCWGSTIFEPRAIRNYVAKRTLISRFNFYLTLPEDEIKIVILSHLPGDFGQIKLIFCPKLI